MAKLVDTYSADKQPTVKRRQLPLLVHDNLTMIMDLNSMGLICDNPAVKGREYEEFARKYRSLTPDELRAALRVECADVLAVLNQNIPCVGCRRNVERLLFQLMTSGHATLDPLVVEPGATLTLREDKLANPHALAALLHGHSMGIECVVESQPRWKKSRRCVLHSLEASGSRAGCGGWVGWGARGAWRDAWDAMHAPCRDHVTLIHFTTLHDTLHNYLRKHRFCADCKTKVLRAYQLLTEEKEPAKEKGYVGALYAGIKRCLQDKHLHLEPDTEYVAALVARAEPELLGSHRERHAKTLEIAQEEVLICLGMCVYERLQRIWLRLREEEGTCQALAAVGVEALYRSFETAVENKTGVSKLQLLYEEITQEELSQQQRKQLKKLRKRKKKARQQCESKCSPEKEEVEETEKCDCAECRDVAGVVVVGVEAEDVGPGECSACVDPPSDVGSGGGERSKKKNDVCNNNNWSSSEHSQDCGYSSENGHCCGNTEHVSRWSLASSPAGSDVACSESFCNHEHGDCTPPATHTRHASHFTMTLQDMLSDTCSSDEERDTSYIPEEDVREFRARRNISEKRQELRNTLRSKFEQLCVNPLPSDPAAQI